MEKKNLFIILGLTILVGVFVILFNASQKEPPAEQTETLTEEEIKEVRHEAIRTGDNSSCEELKNEEDKTACEQDVIISQAAVQKDTTACDQVEESRKDQCRNSIIMVRAIEAKDISICEEMSNEHNLNQCKEYISSLK